MSIQLGQGLQRGEVQRLLRKNGAKTADRTILGYRDGKPIWEVKSGTAYYLVDFETGDFVKMEDYEQVIKTCLRDGRK